MIYSFFSSLLSILLALFFLLLGVICIVIPWSMDVRAHLIQFIIEEGVAISLFGCAFFAIGVGIILNSVLNARRHSYVVKSGEHGFTVDEQVVQQYLDLYWKQLFPANDVPMQLFIKKHKIHIAIELPFLPLPEQKPLLERIKDDLAELFATKLGYYKEFSLAATFKAKPKQIDSPL